MRSAEWIVLASGSNAEHCGELPQTVKGRKQLISGLSRDTPKVDQAKHSLRLNGHLAQLDGIVWIYGIWRPGTRPVDGVSSQILRI